METTNADFISWVTIQMADPDFYIETVREATRRAANYFSYPKPTIMKNLLVKLQRATTEYHSPIVAIEKIHEELQEEYTDILGWYLLQLWNEQKNPRL